MPSPRMDERKTQPIIRTSAEFFPGLAHAEFDEVCEWAEAVVSTKNGILVPIPARPAILDRLERYGVSAARVFAAIMWLRATISAKRIESAVDP
jgi:hypothetical protein